MNTITPIIIPVSHEPKKCPKCHKEEDIKQICRYCGYEYKDEDEGGFFGIIVIIIFAVWFLWTICEWWGSYEPITLLEVLKNQWDRLTHLRIW